MRMRDVCYTMWVPRAFLSGINVCISLEFCGAHAPLSPGCMLFKCVRPDGTRAFRLAKSPEFAVRLCDQIFWKIIRHSHLRVRLADGFPTVYHTSRSDRPPGCWEASDSGYDPNLFGSLSE